MTIRALEATDLPPQRARRRPGRDSNRARPRTYVINTVLALLFLAPLVYSLLGSFKTPAEASASPPTWFPRIFSLENYQAIASLSGGSAWTSLINSTLVAAFTVLLTIVVGVLAGAGFSRAQFRGKDAVFVIVLVALMVPFQSILIPLFYLLHELHLLNSLVGLGLVYTTFQIPFAAFVLRNSFDAIPTELDDAARIDGCGPWATLWHVHLPMLKPGIAAVGIFAFLASWNEFLAALILMSQTSKFTLPVMLTTLQTNQYGSIDWGALHAGVVVATIPSIVVFLIFQRYFTAGLMSGSVKG